MRQNITPNFPAILAWIALFSASFVSMSQAVNHPPSEPGYGSDQGCTRCGKEYPASSEECEDTSFNFSLNLGYARMNRTSNFIDQARQGLREGQGGRGYYRDFDSLRSDFFQTSNTTNRIMEKLRVHQPSIAAALYSPGVLQFESTTGAEYLIDPHTHHLRQVITESTFTDISLIADGYTIRIWDISDMPSTLKDSTGFYPVPAPADEPISQITFRNPDHPATNGRLLLTKKENLSGTAALETTKLYDQSNPDIEIIWHYQGPDTTGPLLEKTTLTFTRPPNARPWDYTFQRVIERASNNNAILGTLVEVSRVSETHRDFSLPLTGPGGASNGKRLMSRTNAPGTSEAQTTTYDYYEDASNKNIHGRLKSVQRPSGRWEYWEYTGDENSPNPVEIQYSSWKNVTFANYQQGIKEETVISANEVTRTTSIAGQQISKNIFLSQTNPSTGHVTYTEKTWDGTEWAIQATVFASHTGTESGRPLHTLHSDGTVTLHQYAVSGSDTTVTTLSGAGNTSAVTAGTKSITTYNRMHEVTFQETRDIESGLQLTFQTGSEFDDVGRAQKWTYNADENDYELIQYSCCGVAFTRARSGATQTYSRDALKRVYKVIRKSSSTDTPITTNTIYNGLTTKTTRTEGTTTLLVSESTSSLGGLSSTSKSPDANGDAISETTTRVTTLDPVNGTAQTTTDPDGITVTYAYNAEGEQTTTTRPMPNGQQSITVIEQDVVSDTFTGVAYRTRSTVNGVLTSTSLSGTHGYRSKSINHLSNNSISTSVRTVPNDGAWTVTSTSPDGTYSVSTTTNGLTVKQEAFGSDDILIMSSEMTYDSFDRVATSTDSRTGTTTMGAYLENGAVTSVTAPGSRTTAFTYDVMGRTLTVDAPDTLDADGNTLSNITTTTYDAAGQVTETNGDQTYRTTHTYDALGRQISMTTYGTETATTTWQYSPTRGFLLAKRDAANKGADYTYTAAGRIATRTWARGVVTTYTYDAGMLVSTDYSDTTPDITLTYDNFGRPITQSNGLANSTFAYDPATLQIDTETIAYNLDGQPGADFTRVIDRSHDNLGRATGWQLKDNTTIENDVQYHYSATEGRLSKVRRGDIPVPQEFNYAYTPQSNLIATITSPAHTVSNVYEPDRNVLASKVNKKLDTTTVSAYFYTMNPLGQRTGVNKDGTAFVSTRTIDWGYNAKGEVVKANHSADTAFNRAYQYDGIGNRLKSADSLTLPGTNNYTPNALNQYTAINSLNPVHDDDGNMTSGPLPANVNANSALIWDGENRLIEAQVTSGANVNYVYDSQSRRIAEKVGSATTVYVYDGWNPIAEYSTTYALTKTYTWGIDLSGSMQGAGGVGGLLMVTVGSTGSADRYFPTFDGNGNVSEYLDSNGNMLISKFSSYGISKFIS